MTRDLSRPEGVLLRLLLVRHGEPEGSYRGRCYGKLDVGLSESGRSQMKQLRDAFDFSSVHGVYSSPRRRALESARALGLAPSVEPRFAEMDFGDLEGMAYDDVAIRYPALYGQWMERPTEVSFPGGESFARLRRRVLEALTELREEAPSQSIAVVSHGGVNRIILADALGVSPGSIFHMDQSYGGINVIDYYPSYPVVRLMNGTAS